MSDVSFGTRRASRLRGALLAAVFACTSAQAAQDLPAKPSVAGSAPGKDRPRIGLVLGGGGAKGAAHVGVLKVLEELRIPIDCIAGTSMGALIGAAYAGGRTTEELNYVATGVNWGEVFRSAPREEVPFHRKQEDYVYTMGLQMGLKEGVRLPKGLIPTQNVETLLRELVSEARLTDRFDQLPIPFKAAATDIVKGELVVLDQGNLVSAMRASMAIPGVFAPVEYQGRLLVDGMLVRNLPVDLARQMCADVVIAVSLPNPPATAADLQSATSVMGQAANLLTDANEQASLRSLGPADVAIIVELGDIGAGSFDKMGAAVPKGEAAARRQLAALARYSVSPQQYAAWQAASRHVEPTRLAVDEVRVTGQQNVNPRLVERMITTQPGEVFDEKKAGDDARRIYARGDYEQVAYGLVHEGDKHVLEYTLSEKYWGSSFLTVDLNFSADLEGNSLWGVRAKWEERWLNSLGGEWRTEIQIGSPMGIRTSPYQPLDVDQRYFVEAGLNGGYSYNDVFFKDEKVGQVNVGRAGVTLDAGIAPHPSGEVRLGLFRGITRQTREVGGPIIPESETVSEGAITARAVWDSLDKVTFATKGQLGVLRYYNSRSWLGADDEYRRLSAIGSATFQYGRNVVSFGAIGGTNLNTRLPFYDQFTAGGMFNLSGFQINELRGQSSLVGTINVRRRFLDLNQTFGTFLYGGATLEAGNVFQRTDGVPSSGAIFASSLYLGLDSKIGPIYLAYGMAEGGRRAAYLVLGSPFASGVYGLR